MLCVISVNVFSQVYVHRMSVESDSLLYVHGIFPSAKGDVYIDSVLAKAISANDTLLVVVLPDSGRGCAGPVEVEVDGLRTAQRMLTQWRIHSYWYSRVNHDSHSFDSVFIDLDLLFRFDYHSLLRNGFADTQVPYFHSHVKMSSCVQKILRVRNDIAPTVEEITLRPFLWGGFNILMNEGRLLVFADTDPGLSVGRFTSYFHIPIVQKFSGAPSSVEQNYLPDWKNRIDWNAVEATFNPPDDALILAYPPMLLEPKHRQQNVPTESITFQWKEFMFDDSVSRIDSFHLQIATDSLFALTVFDTVIAATEYVMPTLTPDTRYFWSVEGINEEGRSRTYSAPRWFSTDIVSSVEMNSSEGDAILIYPNPAFNEITYEIRNNNAQTYTITIRDMNGKVVCLREVPSSQGTFPISDLRSGMYVIEFISDDTIVSRKLQIIR